MDKRQRARALLDNVLDNTHESLKWSWQIVMGFALVSAVLEAYKVFFTPSELPKIQTLHDQTFSFLVFLLGFIPAFIRFFYGDNRYLDLHYLELRQWNDSETYLIDLKHLSMTRRVVDVLLLLTHGIVFLFMGKALSNPEAFFGTYAVLMATNMLWLITTVNLNRTVTETPPPSEVKNLLVGRDKRETESPRRDRAPRFWIANNVVALLLFAGVYIAYIQFPWLGRYSLLYGCLGVCILNSGLDLGTQREFYWPRLDEIYKEAIESEPEEVDGHQSRE